MKHLALPSFWEGYRTLPAEVRSLADRQFQRLKEDPRHPSLHFKRIGKLWSVRIGLHYRALGLDQPDEVAWFWIGSHSDYDRMIRR